MIDVKRIEEAVSKLRSYYPVKSEMYESFLVLFDLAEQVLSAKVPEKYTPDLTTYEPRRHYEYGWNACHDQFTALIARDYVPAKYTVADCHFINEHVVNRDYVHRDKLPTEEEWMEFLKRNIRLDMSVAYCGIGNSIVASDYMYSMIAAAIRERIEKGK